MNAASSYTGMALAAVKDITPPWNSNIVGLSADKLFQRIEALVATFHGTTGHVHDGTNGEGTKVDAADLSNFNRFHSSLQQVTATGLNGTSDIITGLMGGKSPGGDATTLGVLTTAPSNRVIIKNSADGTNFENVEGETIFGRLTESGGVWTVTFFYVDDAGVETSHNLTSPVNGVLLFREIFDQFTRPTIPSDLGQFASTLDITQDVVDASLTERGVVSLGAQSFAGDKVFGGHVSVSNETSITAFASGGQGSAVTLTKDINEITTVATDLDSVKFEAATVGKVIKVINSGAKLLAVFPASGEDIDGLATNASTIIRESHEKEFICVGAGSWRSLDAIGLETQFALANAQATANVTGLLFSSAAFRSVVIEYDITRKTDTGSSEVRRVAGKLVLVFSEETSNWTLESDEFSGSLAGVTLTVTTAGQVQYATTDITGANYVGVINFKNITTFNKAV